MDTIYWHMNGRKGANLHPGVNGANCAYEDAIRSKFIRVYIL